MQWAQFIPAIVIVITLVFNIGLAASGITDRVQCTIQKTAAQTAAAVNAVID